MLSLVIAVLSAAAGFMAGFHWFGVGSGILLGFLTFIAAVIVLGRVISKRLTAAQQEVDGHLRARRIEKAIERLEALRPLGIWHPLLSWSVDEQIGTLRYAGLQQIDEARPFLERARMKSGQAWAMLGASHFKRGRYDEAEQVFQRAMKKRPKERLVWATYAWCSLKRGKKDAALQALGKGRARIPSDEALHKMQIAVQNSKPVKMKAFGQEWLALQLEPVPSMPMGQQIAPTHPALRGMRRRR